MLLKLLAQIEAGKPVNYQKLISLLPPAFQQQKQQLFRVKVTGAGKWQVSIADHALFAQLKHSAEQPADRITASLQGNSHAQLTSQSYLLVYTEHSQQAQANSAQPALPLRPDVVLCQGQTDGQVIVSKAFSAKSKVLLIENEENFFRFDAVLRHCQTMLAMPLSLADCDVVLAAGSRIGGALLQPFLTQYTDIYCAFDYDSAALELVDVLITRYGRRVQLVVAPDVTPWRELFRVTPKQDAQLQKAIQLAEKHGWFGLAQMFRQRKCFLEQEVLLSND